MNSGILFWLKVGNTCFSDLSLRRSHFHQQPGLTCPSILKLWRTNPNTTSHTATRAISEGPEVARRQQTLLLLISPVKAEHGEHPSTFTKLPTYQRPKHAGRCLLISARGKINGLSRNNVSLSYCWFEPPEEVSALQLSEWWVQGQWAGPSLRDPTPNARLFQCLKISQ